MRFNCRYHDGLVGPRKADESVIAKTSAEAACMFWQANHTKHHAPQLIDVLTTLGQETFRLEFSAFCVGLLRGTSTREQRQPATFFCGYYYPGVATPGTSVLVNANSFTEAARLFWLQTAGYRTGERLVEVSTSNHCKVLQVRFFVESIVKCELQSVFCG